MQAVPRALSAAEPPGPAFADLSQTPRLNPIPSALACRSAPGQATSRPITGETPIWTACSPPRRQRHVRLAEDQVHLRRAAQDEHVAPRAAEPLPLSRDRPQRDNELG